MSRLATLAAHLDQLSPENQRFMAAVILVADHKGTDVEDEIHRLLTAGEATRQEFLIDLEAVIGLTQVEDYLEVN
jgi:hypothetical protein